MIVGSAAAILAGAGAQPSRAESLHSEIVALLQRMKQSDQAGDRASARAIGLELSRYSLRDPDWHLYPESFDIAGMLLRLTDPNDREMYAFAAVGVIRSWASGTNAGLIEGQQTIAEAAYGLLRAARNDPTGRWARDCELAGPLLLSAAGVVPGTNRAAWAREAQDAISRYPSETMTVFRQDPLTARFLASGVAMAGDWKSAAAEYEALLANPAAQMTLTRSPNEPFQGLADIVGGIAPLQAEAATVFAMTGQYDRAIRMFEDIRRDALSTRGLSPSQRAQDGVRLEQRLVQGGVVIVQPVVTIVGALALVSYLRNGVVHRRVAFDPRPGGFELFSRMLRSSTRPGSKIDGLVPLYDSLRRLTDADQPNRLRRFVELLSVAAEWLVGSVTRSALSGAGIGVDEDVMVIVPPELGLLPLALCSDLKGGKTLAAQYRLRFADSLVSAEATRAAAARPPPLTPSVALFTGGGAAADLAYQGFETSCVSSHFRSAGSRSSVTQLQGLDGPRYWHVASHAAWDYRNPSRSGLHITRAGIVTVGDISSLRIASPPRLVFLSACETALLDVSKDLRNSAGLTSAFLAAGAAGVIGSLWPVNDAATSLLAARFYDEHLDSGLPPSAALRAAQIWLRQVGMREIRAYAESQVTAGHCSGDDAEPLIHLFNQDSSPSPAPFAHPFFWGGFQLFGV